MTDQTIVEETHNDDIGTADFNFNQLVKAFQQGSTHSLIREVAATVPMKYSTGSIAVSYTHLTLPTKA